MSKNEHAVALGRKAKGVPKTLSRSQRQKLRERMAHARAHRWVWKDPNIEIGVP